MCTVRRCCSVGAAATRGPRRRLQGRGVHLQGHHGRHRRHPVPLHRPHVPAGGVLEEETRTGNTSMLHLL